MTVSEFIKKLEPYSNFELESILHLEVNESVLDKRSYKYPHDNYNADIEIDDVGYSDNVLLLGITPRESR